MDYGPAKGTNRVVDLSPMLAKALGLKTDDVCIVTITDDTSKFGVDVSHDPLTDLQVADQGPRSPRSDGLRWATIGPILSFTTAQFIFKNNR